MAESVSPRALLEAEIDDFHRAVAKYNENLAKQAGMIERLKATISEKEKDVEILTARASAAYAAKDMEKAGSFALKVKDAKAGLESNRAQRKQSEELYQSLIKQRDVYTRTAKEKIDAIKGKISKAEMAEAQAKLTEIASSTAFDMSGSGAALERLDDKLDERIADAQGKVRVATDSAAADEFNVTDAERKAMEAQALSEFASQMGLAAPAAPAAPAKEPVAAPPELGPVDEVAADPEPEA
jgi:phage shock protein A